MPTAPYKNKEGKRIQSVTTIIGQQLGWNKNVLLAWYAKEFKAGNDPTDKSKKACDIGTLCHHYISCDFFKQEIDKDLLQNYEVNAILIAEKALEKTKQILKDNNLTITHSELSLISEQYQYGGTIDVILKRDKTYILSDIKTSNKSKYNPTGIYPDHIIQLGAYRQLIIENKIVEPEEYSFIHIDKDPTIDDKDIVEIVPIKKEIIDYGFEVFKKLIEISKLQKELSI